MRRGYLAGVRGLWEFSFPHVLEGVKPAAGASYSVQLDGRYWWRLHTGNFTLSTDANAANRVVTVQVGLADTVAFVLGHMPVEITASTTNQRFDGSVRTSYPSWNPGSDVLFGLSDFPILGGRTLTINVANVQVGDQLSNIVLGFWRLPTNESIVKQMLGDED